MTQTVIQVGNSLGVTLPAEFVKKHGLKKGSKINTLHTADVVSYSTKTKSTQYIDAKDQEWFDLIKEVESKYGKALDELANL